MYDEAINVFEKVLEISEVVKNNEITDLYFNIAFTYYFAGNYLKAIENLEKDLAFNNKNLETLDYL
jgi:tetratricopeptide (TPR) repeat protein